MLNRKFGLICTVNKAGHDNQYRLYIASKSMDALRKLVLPHMDTSMHYKLNV